MTNKKRVLTGTRPSGLPHIGNYFGAYSRAIALQEKYQLFFFLADFHSLNENPSPEKLKKDSLEIVATMLACGLDPQQTIFYSQSHVACVSELNWVLSCHAPMGFLQRAHAYKDAQAKGHELNAGVFLYPVLMAADILLYDADLVPVGQDQKQHLEMARDLAQRFNHFYKKDFFKLPDPLIAENVAIVPGIDGLKMSKSKGNVISIFSDDKTWKKQVMSIVTDAKDLDEPKDPKACHIFSLYKLFATHEEIQKMEDQYRNGGYGYGHAKLELLKKIQDHFSPMREQYFELIKKPDELKDIIYEGGKSAKKIAQEKLKQLYELIGMF